MKKNKMMRLASVLLILVLLTTSVIGGTFAKYTISATGSDNARVAYWGFQQTTIENFNLFDSDDTGIYHNGSGLLAPGSKGEATISFVYTDNTASSVQAPEVDYTFEIAVTTAGLNGTGTADIEKLDSNPNFLWVLNGVGYQMFADFKAAIEALDGNVPGNKYEAGTLPDAFYTKTGDAYDDNKTHTIGWQWLFDAGSTTTLKDAQGDPITVAANNDEKDTEMGNAEDLEDLTLTITITATQVN